MDNIKNQIVTLQKSLNDRLPSINNVDPIEIFDQLLSLHDNRPFNKPTNMRNLARLFVMKEANAIQITNFHVISRVTDLLLKSVAHSEKLEYHKLASQVNEIIKKRFRKTF
ncbi:hypothetical protein C1646_752717 [Rhizophagus diaphanus]|nr:hypothetical protein C1646_752717 [Rhizophagus diaphanus] [Rhizophagus sp. MUCL 43196]